MPLLATICWRHSVLGRPHVHDHILKSLNMIPYKLIWELHQIYNLDGNFTRFTT